jgi:Mce-associated membrane protein
MTSAEFGRSDASPNGRVKELLAPTQGRMPRDLDEDSAAALPGTAAAEESTTAEDSVSDPDRASDDANDRDDSGDAEGPVKPRRRIAWMRVLTYGLVPGLALLVALAAAFLKWQDSSIRDSDVARVEAVQAAKDSTIALLSYRPDTVDKELAAASGRLTGDFKGAYTKLVNDVVIPGAKQKQISAVATVPAVASVSATPTHATVLVFVNQTVIIGSDAPTDTASSVKVALDKLNGHWLISQFDPI